MRRSRTLTSCWSRCVRPSRAPLGYGAGYYDMLLRDLRARSPAPCAIGVAFAAQEVAEVPTGPRDQMLRMVVTEQRVHLCTVLAAALASGQA